MVIDSDLILLILVGLLNDALYHCNTLVQVLIAVSCDQHIQRLIFINFLSIVNFAFTLRASTSDLDLASAFLLQFLLSGS